MSLFMWISYIIIGIMLFICIKFLNNKYKLSRFDSLLFSIIMLIVVASIFFGNWKGFTDNIFLICVFMFISDLLYTTYFCEKDFFKDDNNILYYGVLVLVSFFLNQSYFNRVLNIFPTGEDIRLIIWLLIIVYLYKFCGTFSIFKNSVKNASIKRDNIIVSYAKLRSKYMDDVDFSNKKLELIVYSIMIYENYRCSSISRKLNNFIFKIDNSPRKLGIMQVESKKFISDVDSIEIVSKKIEKLLNSKTKNKESDVIIKYMGSSSEEVISIYNELVKFNKK